jgi:hypothetical protein
MQSAILFALCFLLGIGLQGEATKAQLPLDGLHLGWLSVKNFGAKGDGQRVFGCTVDASRLILECPGIDAWPGFHAEDVGKMIILSDAGQGLAAHSTTIARHLDASRVVLSAPVPASLGRAVVQMRSTGPNSVGLGRKTFVSSVNWAVPRGVTVKIEALYAPSAFMFARVHEQEGLSLTVEVVAYQGSGSYSEWQVSTLASEMMYGTDDTVALQEAALTVSGSGGKLVFPSGTYLISSTITFAQRTPVGNDLLKGLYADQYDHPRNLRTIEVEGAGIAQVVAARPMASIFHFTYGAAIDRRSSAPTPYSAELRRLSLDGAWMATSCLETSSMREMLISHNKLSWCKNGVFLNGVYGGNRIEYNTIMGCKACVRDMTGDQYLVHNSIAPYLPAPNSTAYGYYTEGGTQGGGNLIVSANTFETVVAPYAGSTTIYPVFIDGRHHATETFRDIVVEKNEFHGATVGVTVLGHEGTPRLAYNVHVNDNHTVVHANGITNAGGLVHLSFVEGFEIRGNSVGDPLNLTDGVAVQLEDCVLGIVSGNTFNRLSASAIVARATDQLLLIGNGFRNVGSTSADDQLILLDRGALRTTVYGNTAHRSSDEFARRFLAEAPGNADQTTAFDNALTGLDVDYSCSGRHSVCRPDFLPNIDAPR